MVLAEMLFACPNDAVVNIIIHNYIVINRLTQHPEFMKSLISWNIATEVTLLMICWIMILSLI